MLTVFLSETEHILFPQYHNIKQVSVCISNTQFLSIAALLEKTLLYGFLEPYLSCLYPSFNPSEPIT